MSYVVVLGPRFISEIGEANQQDSQRTSFRQTSKECLKELSQGACGFVCVDLRNQGDGNKVVGF